MKNGLSALIIGAGLLAPAGVMAQDRDHQKVVKYHDAAHNDDHEWNANEDQAYRRYLSENHRKYRAFSKLKKSDQEQYWNWRHEHPDGR